MNWREVPIPERMQTLPKDARGYPIPFNVFRDDVGAPHFAINDHAKAMECITRRLCPICGGPHTRTAWMAGGPLSAFHPHGSYFDQPMHEECVKYAIVVCPYLAMPKYAKRIDTKTLNPEHVSEHRVFADLTQMPDRPDPFVLVETQGVEVQASKQHRATVHLRPVRPYLSVEFWSKGARISYAEACSLTPSIAVLSPGTSLKGLE